MPIFDQVVVAADFSPKFLNFWPLVSRSWQNIFGVEPNLALVYRPHQLPRLNQILDELKKYGKVHLLETQALAPLGNQAKLARFYVAAHMQESFVTIDDIDTMHIDSNDLTKKFLNVDKGKFWAIGAEVYRGTPHEGAFPAGNFSGPGYLFKELFNPSQGSFEEFINSFNKPYIFHPKENPFNKLSNFSDEYLIRALFSNSKLINQLQHLKRDYDIKVSWIDRSWWPNVTTIDQPLSDFSLINFPRPYLENKNKIDEILDLLKIENVVNLLLPHSLKFWKLIDFMDKINFKMNNLVNEKNK